MISFKIIQNIPFVDFLKLVAFELKKHKQYALFLDAIEALKVKLKNDTSNLKALLQGKEIIVFDYNKKQRNVIINFLKSIPQKPTYIDGDGLKIKEPIFTEQTEIIYSCEVFA